MKFSSSLGAAAVAAATLSLALAAPASARHDKHPPYGKVHVAKALSHMGFVSWDKIEWDDGLWEIDDAVRADGRQFDLKLDPKTFAVVKKEYEGRHGK